MCVCACRKYINDHSQLCDQWVQWHFPHVHFNICTARHWEATLLELNSPPWGFHTMSRPWFPLYSTTAYPQPRLLSHPTQFISRITSKGATQHPPCKPVTCCPHLTLHGPLEVRQAGRTHPIQTGRELEVWLSPRVTPSLPARQYPWLSCWHRAKSLKLNLIVFLSVCFFPPWAFANTLDPFFRFSHFHCLLCSYCLIHFQASITSALASYTDAQGDRWGKEHWTPVRRSGFEAQLCHPYLWLWRKLFYTWSFPSVK